MLSVERAGEEHDIFANTLRQEGIEVLLLTDLLTQTPGYRGSQKLVAGYANLRLSHGPRLRLGYSRLACRYVAPGTCPTFKRRTYLRGDSRFNQKYGG